MKHVPNDWSPDAQRRAIKRVLTLCERALMSEDNDADTLRLVDKGLWTYREIQRHIRAVRRLPILRPTNGRDGEAKPRRATRKGGGR